MDKRIALALLACLAIAGILFFGIDAAPPQAESVPGPPGSTTPDPLRSEAIAAPQPAVELVRTETPDAVAPRDAVGEATGSLWIHTVYVGGESAPGINLYVGQSARGVPTRPLARRISDAEGVAQVDGLPVGKVRLKSDRGADKEVEIAAGQMQEVTLELEAGLEVAGAVQDELGAPVAAADIWLTSFSSPWMAGAVVAQSGVDGSFRLLAVPKEQSLGALAPGHAPSELVDLELQDTALSPVRIVLVLGGSGGVLTGRITDTGGRGLAGAMVAVGRSDRLIDSRRSGTMLEKWSPRVVRTDSQGHYLIDSLAPGEQPVEIWANGFSFWRGECTIAAGERTVLDVQLPASVIVSGVVRGPDREPMSDAVVRAFPNPIRKDFLQGGQYDYESTFGYPFALTDAEGSYRIPTVAPGEVYLFAGPLVRHGMGEVVPWAETVLRAEPGASLEWNPIVEPGPSIAGVVRYRDGEPMAHHFVSVLEPGTKNRQSLTTDQQGRFRFVHLEHRSYDLAVQFWSAPKGTPPLGAREVWPDRGELELVAGFDSPKKLAKGSVHGSVVDAGHRLTGAGAFATILVHEDHSWRTNPETAGTSFGFEDIDPGRHRVIVMSGEDPVLVGDWFELQPAEHKQLGTLVTEPGGTLRLQIERPPGAEQLEPTIYVTMKDAGHGRRVALGTATEQLIDNLSAGEHRISGWAEGMVAIESSCQVIAGTVTEAPITLQPATLREIVIDYAATQQLVRILVIDAQGENYLDYQGGQNLSRPYRRKLRLPVGSFTLTVETATGTASAAFEVTSLSAEQPAVQLQAN